MPAQPSVWAFWLQNSLNFHYHVYRESAVSAKQREGGKKQKSEREGETERERDRETDRLTDGERERETDGRRERERERERDAKGGGEGR